MDPGQWSAYYGYGQGYDAYAYGAVQDPSLYAYSPYAGYAQYPQQVISTHVYLLCKYDFQHDSESNKRNDVPPPLTSSF